MAMTPRQRMLAAYRGETTDVLPIAPEFWYYVPARLLGVDMVTFEREVPLWQALQRTFAHYGTEGWGIVGASAPTPGVRAREEWTDLGDGRFESRSVVETPYGTLRHVQRYDRAEPSWPVERRIKDFRRDWPAYEACTLGLVEQTDFSGVQAALNAVDEDYLLEVAVASPFFDYIGTGREGGHTQAVFDLLEQEEFLSALHRRYLDHVRRVTRAVFANTTAEAVFVGCCWSCLSLLSPAIWRRWDRPVIEAVAEEAHAAGGLLHVHLHGKCMGILEDLAGCGADCICPFERPPGGDVTDLAHVRSVLAGRTTVNGNVHTVETLIRGGPDDVRREVTEILTQWGPDRHRLILGTGDQVGRETPDENIRAMVEAGRNG
jgi:hypothetical protein